MLLNAFNELEEMFFWWEFFPIYRRFDFKRYNKSLKTMDEMRDIMKSKFKSHLKSYSETVIRDFCDSLISAKNDALNEGKESAPYLTDDNLAMTVFELFFAGTETSQQTFRWILLFYLFYPKIGQKLRQEIESQIGDRIATHEDRNRCHYVMAFISEILRLRNVGPTGVTHKAVVTSRISNDFCISYLFYI